MATEPRLVIRWRGLLEPSIDAYSMVVSLGWALVFFLQPDLMRQGSYAAMAALAEQTIWAYFLLVSAAVQALGIVVRKPPVRFIAQTGASALWMFIALMLSSSGFGIRTGLVAYGGLSLFLLARTLRPERP